MGAVTQLVSTATRRVAARRRPSRWQFTRSRRARRVRPCAL